ncbi:MAG: helix-turn-helix domain-containing protein [Conexivisphaerales archaeon]
MTWDKTSNGPEAANTQYSIDDSLIQKLVTDLTLYGLTANQAKLYLHLLRNKPAGAREISRALNVHRVDVYRRLRELEELGIIEVHLDFPKKFTAIDPKTAIESLIQRNKSKVNELEQAKTDLQRRLNEVGKLVRLQSPNDVYSSQESFYKFTKGTTQYFAEIARLFKSARHEILKISSANGLRRATAMGLYKYYLRAYERGVKIRLITDVVPENRHYAQMFAKVTELRHISDVHFRFTIADRSVVLLSAKYDDKKIIPSSGYDNYFLFRDTTFASALCFIFERLWEGADTFERRMEQLDKFRRNSRQPELSTR